MNPRVIGIALLVASVLAALLALWLVYTTWNRFAGVSRLELSANARLAGDRAGTLRTARSAVSALGDQPAAALPAIDLNDAGQRDVALAGADRSRTHRDLYLSAAAIIDLSAGRTPSTLPEGADGAWLAAARDGRDAPDARAGAPSAAVLAATLPRLLAAALARGDAAAVQRHAGALLLLLPRHPRAEDLRLLLLALDPAIEQSRLSGTFTRMNDLARRVRIVRQALALAPARAAALQPLLAQPGARALTALELLTAEVQAAAAVAGEDEAVLALVRRCLDAGRPELVAPLLPRVPAAQREATRWTAASALGDAVVLAGAPAGSPHALRVSRPLRQGDQLTFHVGNAAGTVIAGGLAVFIDGQPAGDRLTRRGSLHRVRIDPVAPVAIEVRAGDRSLLRATVEAPR
jgi:hypothetical protein